MNGYAELHPLSIAVRADVLEIAAGYDEERAERELSFAISAVDYNDPTTLEWLAVMIDRRLMDLQSAESDPPPIYDPGISEEVSKFAERIAEQVLVEHGDDYREPDGGLDTPGLYRIIRISMGRPVTPIESGSSLDDDSISDGIVRAINIWEGRSGHLTQRQA